MPLGEPAREGPFRRRSDRACPHLVAERPPPWRAPHGAWRRCTRESLRGRRRAFAFRRPIRPAAARCWAPAGSSASRSTLSQRPRRSIRAQSTTRSPAGLRDREQARLWARDRPQRLAEIARAARVPVLAIGGINVARVAEVLAAGPVGVAVMGGVMRAADPGQAMKALLATWRERRGRDARRC